MGWVGGGFLENRDNGDNKNTSDGTDVGVRGILGS